MMDDDFTTLEDGYVYYWPVHNRGAYSENYLRDIADELARRNAVWDKTVREDLKRLAAEDDDLTDSLTFDK